jgi:hypothetical protein
MRFRGRWSFSGGSSRCRRHLPSSDAGSLVRGKVRTSAKAIADERTERCGLLPTEYLLGKRRDERKIGLVVEGWQAICANHPVNLFLGLVLCGWVHQHREEESLEDRDGLRALSP